MTNELIVLVFNSETGGICLSPRPSAPGAEIRPSMPMRPFFGIEPVLADEKVQSYKILFLMSDKLVFKSKHGRTATKLLVSILILVPEIEKLRQQ